VALAGLAGLAGLPPGLAGLFAKVTVIDSLLDGDALWLAIIVALNAVIGLVYYVRLAAVLFREGRHREPEEPARNPVAGDAHPHRGHRPRADPRARAPARPVPRRRLTPHVQAETLAARRFQALFQPQ
jgi:NADH-quinone oxidoreductase subunit N